VHSTLFQGVLKESREFTALYQSQTQNRRGRRAMTIGQLDFEDFAPGTCTAQDASEPSL
jgi:hypothetical protein